MAVSEMRLVGGQDGTWDLSHGSWMDVDDGAVTLHLVRSGDPEEEQHYTEDLAEAQALLTGWGMDPSLLACKGFDEDGDLFELR